MKIVIPRSVRLVLSAEKWNVEQTIVNYGQFDKICKLYLQPVVKTFSLSRIGRTLVKIRQTRLVLRSVAMDEGKRELRVISSVGYSFSLFLRSTRTILFGMHWFDFGCLHYYCLGIIRKLCEQLSTYPSNDLITVTWWQVMVNYFLGEG